MNLSRPQQKIVDHQGHIVAAAPPGSGKTRIIIERTKRLLEIQKGPIKLVTFTRAAAQEMKNRIGSEGRGRVEAATFDSYCYRMSKMAGNTLTPPNALKDYIAKRKTAQELALEGPEDLDELMAPAATRLRPEKAGVYSYDAYRTYLGYLKETGNIDFASIARGVVESMSKGGKIKPLKAAHLLVDEFQDADEIQLAWVIGHAKLAGSQVMVVGDDDQSIYGFRGGLGYAAMKKIESRLGAEVIMLDQCFRCRPEIVEHARVLIAKNKERFHKPVMAPRSLGGIVEHLACLNEDIAVKKILAKANELGDPKFAVLGRRNKDLDKYQALLTSCGIEVDRVGGKSFWKAPGARAMIELLSVIIDRTRENSLKTVLNYISPNHNDDNVVMESVRQGYIATGKEGVIVDKHKKKIVDIILGAKKIEDLKCQRDVMVEVVNLVRDNEESGWKEFKAASTAVNVIQRGLQDNEDRDLIKTINTLRRGIERGPTKEEIAKIQATVSTMHGSKGREWPLVFIINANEGITPNKRGSKAANDSALPEPEDLSEIEEERRLFYVAATRAEDYLFVISTEVVGKTDGYVPSRFIEEAAIMAPGEKKREPAAGDERREKGKSLVQSMLAKLG